MFTVGSVDRTISTDRSVDTTYSKHDPKKLPALFYIKTNRSLQCGCRLRAQKADHLLSKLTAQALYGRVGLLTWQTDATLLANNSQHCWMLHVESVCTPCCMLLDGCACCAKFETGQTFSPCKQTQHCRELLRPFACSFT